MIDRFYCQNFRRIGECDIELRDGLTVLTGKNGTGKSSIIEAMTFCLYAKLKANTKKESVPRANAPEGAETSAIMDFTVRGVHYRCRRWYTKKLSTMANLYSFTNEEYEKLHESPMTEFDKNLGTEIATGTTGVSAAVEEILGVDYEGFKASFVAQQKELDSFASLATEKRREFFLNLLQYDALDKAKPELSTRVKSLKSTIKTLEGQNLNVKEIKSTMEKARKDLEKLEASVMKGEDVVAKAQKDYNQKLHTYEDVQVVAERTSAYEADVKARNSEKGELSIEIANLDARIAKNMEKTKDFNPEFSIADQLHQRMAAARAFEAYRNKRAEKERLEAPLKELERDITRTHAEVEALTVRTQKEPDVDAPMKKYNALQSELEILRHTAQELSIKRKDMASLIDSVSKGEARKCPSCGNEISTEEGRKHLAKELAEIDDAVAKNIAKGKAKRAECDKAKEELEDAQRAAATYNAEKRSLEGKKSKLEASEKQYEKDAGEFARVVDELSQLEIGNMSDKEKLENDAEIVNLTKLKEREDEMRTAAIELSQDVQAKEFKEGRLKDIDAELSKKVTYLNANRKQVEMINTTKSAMEEAKEKLDSYVSALNERKEARAVLTTETIAMEGNLVTAKKQEEQLVELKTDLENCYGAQQVVETLRKTLPSRIAPRLADVAGHLLSVATNGTYSMMELDENYEVSVYTDTEVRPLSQMSGGETDVIALCLRIAVAKILLESAGMAKQSFILDEIFGALDDERRESTCNALGKIQDELSKILCITHIDEIKDMADYTYVVEKDNEGTSWVREIITGDKSGSILGTPEEYDPMADPEALASFLETDATA